MYAAKEDLAAHEGNNKIIYFQRKRRVIESIYNIDPHPIAPPHPIIELKLYNKMFMKNKSKSY